MTLKLAAKNTIKSKIDSTVRADYAQWESFMVDPTKSLN